MSELFEIQACESPRLKWMRRNAVSVAPNKFKPSCSDDWRYAYSTIATCPGGVGYGNSDDDAIVDLAKKQGWKLWNEE